MTKFDKYMEEKLLAYPQYIEAKKAIDNGAMLMDVAGYLLAEWREGLLCYKEASDILKMVSKEAK